MKRILCLHLRRIWFDKVKSGEKMVEFKKASPYWRGRLIGKSYDEVHVMLGYPNSNQADRIIKRKFNGYWRSVLVDHPEFGPGRVPVFAIDVSVKL